VPSTSPLSLTVAFRRAEMKAFWILTTAMLSVALGLASAALGVRAPWAWGAVGLCLPLPGLVWPQWFEIGIRAWNKGVRVSAALLRTYVLKVCYYLLFGAASRTGSSLDLVLGKDEVSRWIPRARHDPTPGAWTVCLRPVLLLLLLLRDEAQESAPPTSTYTLY
jgi:hypothetical protein